MLVRRLSVLSRPLRAHIVPGIRVCPRCAYGEDRGLLMDAQQWSSSVRPKKQANVSENCRMELLEVLETRVQQLEAEENLPVPEHKTSTQYKEKKRLPQAPKRWMEKLQNEQLVRHERQGRLEKNGIKLKPISDISLENKSSVEQNETHEVHLAKVISEVPLKMSSVPAVEKLQESKSKSPKKEPSKKNYKRTEDETDLWKGQREQLLEDKEGNRHGGHQLSILCYLEICVFLKELERAQMCLNFYHHRTSRRNLLTIAMYNLLMKAWAKKGSVTNIGHLFVMLEEAGLKPNLGSYAAALECMGRSDTATKSIEMCLSQLEEDGLSIDQLFQEFLYKEDERDMILKAVRKVQPIYQLPLQRKSVCTSPLVKDFYSKDPPPSYPKLDFTLSELYNRFKEQLAIESCDTITIASVEASKPIDEGQKQARDLLNALRSRWKKALLQAFRDSKIHLEMKSRMSPRIDLYPYLCLLEEDQYVDIMLQSLTNIPPTGESFLVMSRDMGTKINNRYSIHKKLKAYNLNKIKVLYRDYCQLLAKNGKVSGLLPREMWEQLEQEKYGGPSLMNVDTIWPNTLLVQLGTHLVDLMVQEIKVPNDLLSSRDDPKLIPVLYHMYSFRSTKQIGLIKPHPIFSQIQLDARESCLTFESSVMPMLCPPVPWMSPRFGAYLLSPAKLMRCMEGAVQHQLLLEKSPPGQLYPVLDSLNQLGMCAWRINQTILDIIVSIFNLKGNEKLDIPPPISEAPKMPEQPHGDVNSKDKLMHQRELARCRKKSSEMHSLRMDALYKLSIASHLRDKIFWFPHNMDFRGRTYPCPPYFNHLGSDVTRALLLFAEGRPLGPKGLEWLKIHLINLTGLKKRNSLKERKEYADAIMDDILDSADNPLKGKRWWMEADEPWQALACCMEIAKASRSPDPTKYISHFPVHQDGSCNGLQHYAALGRDEIGAKSVNLMPCDTPQDVYSGVAQQVEEFCKRDAQRGVKIAQILDGFIGRKVVKQTVMTVVYGVTRYGGRLQIEKRLREMDNFPKEYVWEASHYLVQQVFSSLKEMFSGTREIQLWLTESARMISKSGNTVEWQTPLGLPIIQPYHRAKPVLFHSNLQVVNLQSSHDVNERPDTMKQKNAFPPNFIHSLDSTHMMLTALHCYSHGLTFVSVHDCFWTHPDTVDVMNKVCREQFVALHSQPILQNLSQFLLQKYCHTLSSNSKAKMSPENLRMVLHFSNVPETGDFDLRQVIDSTYFFS
ncbi:hypothetical protein XELAEV_18006459mg [Xenopus laevis]|uniref:DNA-directed RNA polymerase n=1 Tax=Xenopus laevis TaxID=8355 RepID=A0A974DYW6_XENLA|nr:hypothetical protein XELAEV_18006459mg [Xenopus laevis]